MHLRQLHKTRVRAAAVAFTACALIAALAAAPAALAKKQAHAGLLQTPAALPGFALGIQDGLFAKSSTAPAAFAKAETFGARYLRIGLSWRGVAPSGSSVPAGFNPRDPADGHYNWSSTDREVRAAYANDMTPYFVVTGAPDWAEHGTAPKNSGAGTGAWQPDAAMFGDFAYAAAERYSGSFTDPATGLVPAVTIWEAWNEPNLPLFLAPTSVELYRALLNSFYDAVKEAQPGSTVIAGALAPVKSSSPAAYPKDFAQSLLCVTPNDGTYFKDPSCPAPAKFDIFSVHPYSLRAGPNQRASIDGNMFVADVIDIDVMLVRAQQVQSVSAGPKQIWATEFAWVTNPPNSSLGDPPALAAQRTSIALYNLWRSGVTQVTWFPLSDNSGPLIPGTGIYDSSGQPKPLRQALAFPFYVRQKAHRGYTWGKAPQGSKYRVLLQRRGADNKFHTVAKIKPRLDGLFAVSFRSKATKAGQYRVQQHGAYSVTLGSQQAFQ